MKQVTTQAIVYKIHKYSDRSAVAFALTPEYGKIKLFISKAFSKKGGIMKFIPGSLAYTSKETTDLNKFVSFAHEPEYYTYIDSPEIICRMHLLFDFFDNMFDFMQPSPIFWTLLHKYKPDNYKELTAYTLYRLFRDAGFMFDLKCSSCGCNDDEMILYNDMLYCVHCHSNKNDKLHRISKNTMSIITAMPDSNLYKNIILQADEEKSIIELFSAHIDKISGKENTIKSFSIFKNIMI